MKEFQFSCSCCGEIHKGVPSFGARAPIYFYYVPQNEREERTSLTSNTCVIDDEEFFIYGCLEMPIIECEEIFVFGVWISLSESNFYKFQDLLSVQDREHQKPMVGWLSSWIHPFEGTEKLKARIHFRNNGIRPYVELEPTEHPLAVTQKNGISEHLIDEMYGYYVHGSSKS